MSQKKEGCRKPRAAIALLIGLLLMFTVVASSAAGPPVGGSSAGLAVRDQSANREPLQVTDDIWYLEKLTLELLHEPPGGTETETIELPLGETTAFKEWEHILPPSTARVYQRLEFSYPDQLVGDQPGSFTVYGSSGVTIEGPSAVTVYFEVDMIGSSVGTCPGDVEWYNDIKPPDRHVYYDSPDMECQLKASQLLGVNERRFTAKVHSRIFDQSQEYGNTLRLYVTYKRGAAPPPPPPATTTVQGRVYVPDKPYPLIGAQVQLIRFNSNGTRTILDKTVTEAPYGQYVFYDVPVEDNLEVWAYLRHAARTPNTFRVVDAPAAQMGHAFTGLNLDPNAPVDPLIQDIVFSEESGVNSNVAQQHLDDLGIVYYHLHQAWQLADRLNQHLDLQLPVDVYVFSVNSDVYWLGPYTTGDNANVDPRISISAAKGLSEIGDGNRPDNREWHEFGHHVMGDAFGDLFPEDTLPCPDPKGPGFDCNHWGYLNASTTDSWAEGFAEFYSMMVAREIAGEARPELYRWRGWEDNFEANWLAWSFHQEDDDPEHRKYHPGLHAAEEFAVAGLLLDLVDPVDGDDRTVLGDTDYADCIQVSLNDTLWPLLTRNWLGTVPGPPGATPKFPNYGYIFDVKHLYDALKYQGVGAGHTRERAFDDLDELFIAHGFFADISPPNLKYDPGEEIGRAAHAGAAAGKFTIDPQPQRRDVPPTPGSYIAVRGKDAVTGAAVDLQAFDVEVRFASPFEHLSYRFQTAAGDNPRRLYFHGPAIQFAATTAITAQAPGYVSTEPLVVRNDDYYQQMAAEPGDYFMQHTFEMEPLPGTYLPVVLAGMASQRQNAHINSQTPQTATSAHTPAPCLPDEQPPPLPAPIVQAVAPAAALEGLEVRLAITGQNFAPGATPYVGASLLRDVEQPDSEHLQGTLLPGLTPGLYDVSVINPDGQIGELEDGFTITEASGGLQGINGRVTYNGQPASGLHLELGLVENGQWSTVTDATTGSDGSYDLSAAPSLSAGQEYVVRYLNTLLAPNPGAGYLWSWFGNRIAGYTAGTVLGGGDMELGDIPLSSPADQAVATLPAEFCWVPRSEPTDNYVLIFYDPLTEQWASTGYLGYASCATVTGLPAGWPSDADYVWWVRVFQGDNPEATPYNYGDSRGSRSVRLRFSGSTHGSQDATLLQPAHLLAGNRPLATPPTPPTLAE